MRLTCIFKHKTFFILIPFILIATGCSKSISNEYVSVTYNGYEWEGDYIRIKVKIKGDSYSNSKLFEFELLCYNKLTHPENIKKRFSIGYFNNIEETTLLYFNYRKNYDSRPCKTFTLAWPGVGEFNQLNIGPP